MNYFKLCLYFICCLGIKSSNVEAQRLHFNTLTVNDGLSQHDATSIIQDSYGFIWIGTYDGLNRFDGYSIKNFSSIYGDVNSLSSNRIKCLFKDSKNRIWIGTEGSGLNYYSSKDNTFFRIKTTERYSTINCIAENSVGEIFVGTENGILKVKEGNTINLELLQIPLTGVVINKMAVAKDNTLYIATNQGIWKLKEKVCEQISLLGNDVFSAIVLDNHNKLWAATRNSIIVMDRNKNSSNLIKIPFFETIEIKSLCLSKNNMVWVGTNSSGLFGIDASTYKILTTAKKDKNDKRGLLSNTILNVFCDKTNTLWVSNRKGVCFANLEEKKFKEIDLDKDKFSESHIRRLYVQDDYVYFGIQSNGFYRYSRKTKSIETITSDAPIGNFLTVNKVNGALYLGTTNGVYKQLDNTLFLQKKT